jgi:hypothetical protein
MPSILQSLKNIAPIKHSLHDFKPDTLRGIEFICAEAQRTPTGDSILSTHALVVQICHLDTDANRSLITLIICIILDRTVTHLVIEVLKT